MNETLRKTIIKENNLEDLKEDGMDLIVSLRFSEFGDLNKFLELIKEFNKIHWEFIEWIEKDNLHARFKGVDNFRNEYDADGSYDPVNDEMTELYEFKKK
jgi:hypothetical protein